jgi:Mlc titration factor MtfA (ptsG expression regulator)
MLFSWLRKRRRAKLLAEPVPAAWQSYLEQVAHYGLLPVSDRGRVQTAARIIVAEKEWEGCGGLTLTQEMQVVIAGLAAILVAAMDDFYFDNVQTILVYPKDFLVPQKEGLSGEAILESESDLLGQAHYRGPVILSWAEIEEDIANPGHGQNLVFHEFAHQLDMLNGEADGVPLLRDRGVAERWPKVMAAAYNKLVRASTRRRDTLLDPYGAENPAEFFAVATESFFDQPLPLRDHHPDLYALLRDYYHQDPATWPGWPRFTV